MKRLLHILAYKPRGTRTIDHLMFELARQGRQRGWELRFAVVADPSAEFGAQLHAVGASCLRFEHPLTWGAARRLCRDLAGWRPDVTQTSFLSAFCGPLLWMKVSGFTKRLVVIDQSSGAGPDPRSRLARLRKLRGRVVGRIVDAVAPVSEFNARRDVDRVFLPAAKVHTIHNGIALERFAYHPRSARSPVRIVYAGQLIPEKGVATLLEAAAVLEREGLPFELHLAGAGPQRAALEKACSEAGLRGVRFCGHVDDMPGFFGSADIAVVPSAWAEAFGYVVVEAMACGAVVVGSTAGAIPEVIGPAGLTFPAGDAAALTDRLRALIGDPGERARLSALGRSRVETHFLLERKVRRHLDLCDAVLEGKPFGGDPASGLWDASGGAAC